MGTFMIGLHIGREKKTDFLLLYFVAALTMPGCIEKRPWGFVLDVVKKQILSCFFMLFTMPCCVRKKQRNFALDGEEKAGFLLFL